MHCFTHTDCSPPELPPLVSCVLLRYGYKITGAMGVKLAKLSPTRGFCAELATALVIMVASQ